MIKEAIKKVVDGTDLLMDEAAAVMSEIMSGEATPSQIACLITAMRIKGESVDEITGFAKKMREFAIRIDPKVEELVDTCGTGGDYSGTFNISTISAIVAAAAGAKIAKHGNRSASSKCGSADILEALGVKIDIPPEKVKQSIEDIGIGFLYAPNFHPAMKFAGPTRKEIGIRTIFNLLGPLTNPAGAKNQLVGVFSAGIKELIAKVLKNLGSREVMVVHGRDTLDEISVCDRTDVSHLKDGRIKNYDIDPKKFGIKPCKRESILGGSIEDNVRITNEVLNGVKGAKRDIVLLNSAAVLVLGKIASELKEGIEIAGEIIDNGKARSKLKDMIEFSRSV